MIEIGDGVALMHPAEARALGLKEGDPFLGAVVKLTAKLTMPREGHSPRKRRT